MRLGKVILGAAMSAMVATSAIAADLPTVGTAPPPPPPMATHFGWDGKYLGVFTMASIPFYPTLVLGGTFGWNMVRGNLVAGAEIDAFVGAIPTFFAGAHAHGRLGFLVGDRAMLYGLAGVGWSGLPFWSYGGGVEFALRDTKSIFVDVAQWRPFGGGPPPAIIVNAGINFHR